MEQTGGSRHQIACAEGVWGLRFRMARGEWAYSIGESFWLVRHRLGDLSSRIIWTFPVPHIHLLRISEFLFFAKKWEFCGEKLLNLWDVYFDLCVWITENIHWITEKKLWLWKRYCFWACWLRCCFVLALRSRSSCTMSRSRVWWWWLISITMRWSCHLATRCILPGLMKTGIYRTLLKMWRKWRRIRLWVTVQRSSSTRRADCLPIGMWLRLQSTGIWWRRISQPLCRLCNSVLAHIWRNFAMRMRKPRQKQIRLWGMMNMAIWWLLMKSACKSSWLPLSRWSRNTKRRKMQWKCLSKSKTHVELKSTLCVSWALRWRVRVRKARMNSWRGTHVGWCARLAHRKWIWPCWNSPTKLRHRVLMCLIRLRQKIIWRLAMHFIW